MKKKCVLASQSPRRRELMTFLNVPFNVIPPNITETFDPTLTIAEQIESIAHEKAFAVYSQHSDRVVIGADTVVIYEGNILGKPKTPENAIEMLRLLSGKTHEVITGVSMISSETQLRFHTSTMVTFYELTDEEILGYVETKDPLDKAGAYSIQGQGGLFVKSIEGDFYSIVGLPIARVHHELVNREW